MKTIKQLEKQKLEIENQIAKPKAQEETKDFIKVKGFRIYKWAKSIKDFPIPKGYRMAEEREFADLYDSGFKIEQYPVIYFTKNRSKLNIKNGWSLSRLDLGFLVLDSNNVFLADSYDAGRVVVVKLKEGEKLT